jgi:hypothetical protein
LTAESGNTAPRLQILLSDRWLVTLNATDEVAEMVLPEGNGAPFLLCRRG